jgi:hypothetical protein
MGKARIMNRSEKQLTVQIEPWADELYVESGSDLLINFEDLGDEKNCLAFEFRDSDYVAIWLKGNKYEVDIG